METKTLVRIGALGFAVTVVIASVVDGYTAVPAPQPDTAADTAAPSARDPLRAQLLRCQSIDQASASDAACLRAWAANRSRFFMSPGSIDAGKLTRGNAAVGPGSPSDPVPTPTAFANAATGVR